ncbi:MAG: radical SAM protein [Dehalococcoidia bacterium]
MRTGLLNPIQHSAYPQPPMGLALIAAVLEKGGHQVTLLDANAMHIEPADVTSHMSEVDVIMLTAMTPTINAAADIDGHAKKDIPNIPIILGGAHATLMPDETLAAIPEIDIIVRGEGEETIVDLLEAIEQDRPLDSVPGITFRRYSEIIHTEDRKSSVDLDSLPFLAYHLLPLERYNPHPPHGRAKPVAAVITSRGCPYRCGYCSKPVFGNKFRGQSPPRVADEISFLMEHYGVKEIAFYDDVFTLDKKRARAICEEILRRNLKIHWTCETRVNLVDRKLLEAMRKSGCYSIAYGIESASLEILEAIGKDITLEQVREAIEITHEAGIQTVGYFMIGSPGETPETIARTIDFAKELKLDFAQFSITTPFPATKLYEMYRQINQCDIPWESFVYAGAGSRTAPAFETDRLSKSDLDKWTARAYREFYLRPSYFWQRIRGIRSWGDLRLGFSGISMLVRNISSR